MTTNDKVIVYIRDYMDGHGFAPSMEDIRKGVGLASKSTVFKHLDRLEAFGHIVRQPGKPRAMYITSSGRRALTAIAPLHGIEPKAKRGEGV